MRKIGVIFYFYSHSSKWSLSFISLWSTSLSSTPPSSILVEEAACINPRIMEREKSGLTVSEACWIAESDVLISIINSGCQSKLDLWLHSTVQRLPFATSVLTRSVYSCLGLVPSIQLWTVDISTDTSMVALKIADSFSKRKVSFPYSLINSRPDMRVKPIFVCTTLDMGLYFCICIYHFSFFLAFKRAWVVGR